MDNISLEDVQEIVLFTESEESVVFKGDGIYALRDWLNEIIDAPPRSRKAGATPSRSQIPQRELGATKSRSQKNRPSRKGRPEEKPARRAVPEVDSDPESESESPPPPTTRPLKKGSKGGYSTLEVNYQKNAGTTKDLAAQMRAQAEQANFQF